MMRWLHTPSFKPHNSQCVSLSQNLHRPTWDYIDRIQFPILHRTTNSTFCKFIRLMRTNPPALTRSALSGSETPHHFSMCFLFVFGFWVLICEIVLYCVFFYYYYLLLFFMRFRCLIYCLWDFFVRMVVLLHTQFLFFDLVHVFVIFWSWNFVGFTLCGARRRVSHCSYSWIWCFCISDLRIVWEEGME